MRDFKDYIFENTNFLVKKHVDNKANDDAQLYGKPTPRDGRRTKINAGGADYVVYAINCGKMNPTGKTLWDWSIYDELKTCEIFFGRYEMLIGAPGSLKVGDKIFVVDNDTQKKLSGAPSEVTAVCKCNKDDFEEMIRSHKDWSMRCKRPTRAFGKISDGLPWSRFRQMYSIKGVTKA